MGIVDKLQEEFDLEVEWLGYELRPDTPPQGKLLRDIVTNFDPNAAVASLNRAGAPYGITFKPYERVSNTRLALEASEFARDQGLYEAVHKRLLSAFFQAGEDIGDKETLLRLMAEIGLDRVSLAEALDNGVYTARLQAIREKAKEHDVMSLPTFIINDQEKIVGARPYETFQQSLRQIRDGV